MPEEFAAELRALRSAASSPTYGQLVYQASQQRPPVVLTPQSLSEWFAGKAVPADPAAVRPVRRRKGTRAEVLLLANRLGTTGVQTQLDS
ncbi:hypothetical protein ACPPVO_22970 [Dactylosporangium sp. McL0621]|uniref:hypothetical protein n=1 Tax=Dactylosporangium sp. McL0621 TaxID=3415678 RepID=UPI003CED4C55